MLGEQRDRARRHLELEVTEAAFCVGERALKQRGDRRAGERHQHEYLHPRKQGAVQLKAGVLGGGPDEGHRAAFDVRQEGILLGPVEAVDLVAEEHSPPPEHLSLFRFADDLLHPRYAIQHRRELHELPVGVLGNQSGNGGLAGPRRAPEDAGPHISPANRIAQGAAGAEELFLTQALLETPRPHARSERLRESEERGGGGHS